VAKFDLRTCAKVGVVARVTELKAELTEIYRVFPELRRAGGADGVVSKAPSRKRKRRNLTAAQRAEISRRMKKRWAAAKRAGLTRLG
jgi:hypothetical protein